jgi:hypothetical protein
VVADLGHLEPAATEELSDQVACVGVVVDDDQPPGGGKVG